MVEKQLGLHWSWMIHRISDHCGATISTSQLYRLTLAEGAGGRDACVLSSQLAPSCRVQPGPVQPRHWSWETVLQQSSFHSVMVPLWSIFPRSMQAKDSISHLKVQLDEARAYRQQEEECELVRHQIAQHPPREESEAAIVSLQQELEALEKENVAASRALDLRRKQFSLLLHTVLYTPPFPSDRLVLCTRALHTLLLYKSSLHAPRSRVQLAQCHLVHWLCSCVILRGLHCSLPALTVYGVLPLAAEASGMAVPESFAIELCLGSSLQIDELQSTLEDKDDPMELEEAGGHASSEAKPMD